MRIRVFRMMSAGAARLGALVLLSLLMLSVALADETDPPGRVARLSYVQGAVSLEPAGAQDWVAAELNRPVTTSDKLWSDIPGSRAELDIGGAVIRMSSGTGFSFLNLDDNIAQMQVTSGTVVVHVREMLENQTYEIDTPNVAVLLDQAGQYRVDVNEAGDTTVVRVSDGAAEASGGGQSVPIANQQVMTFLGTDRLSVIPATLGAPDGFDDWSFERDREYDEGASRQYVSDDMVGTEDLDENGQWQDTPDYGAVWIPAVVAAGWAPYSFGHWAWIAPWGWTWVDSASWGFAPFHYGRWARWRNSWCWVPGPRQARAMYSPAMVAWVGGGAAGAGAGVGWFPLGPREVFVPGYRVSERYVRTINVTNTTIVDHDYITNVSQNRISNLHYANSGVPGAVTTVPQSVFASAQSVNAHRLNVSAGQGARLATTATPPAITPVRQSALGGSPGGVGRRPPTAVLNRVVVARTTPPVSTDARVRLVGPPPKQVNRGESFNRPGALMPTPPAPGDTRSWAERERALEHSSLPSAPASRDDRPPAARDSGDDEPAQNRFAPNGQFRENNGQPARPVQAPPQDRFNDQDRPPVNSYTRPQADSRPAEEQRDSIEERRATSAPERQQQPGTHFTAPPPPPAPVPTAPQTPARPAQQTQQKPPSASHTEEHPPSRAPARVDPR
jgi:hypothetical protein